MSSTYAKNMTVSFKLPENYRFAVNMHVTGSMLTFFSFLPFAFQISIWPENKKQLLRIFKEVCQA